MNIGQKKFNGEHPSAILRMIRGNAKREEFADFLGISVRTLYRYEKGERNIPEGLLRLAKSDQWSKYRIENIKNEIKEPNKIYKSTNTANMSNAFSNLIKIYESGNNDLIKTINRALVHLANEVSIKRGDKK